MNRVARVVILGLALLLVAGGCSGDDGADDTSSTKTTTPELDRTSIATAARGATSSSSSTTKSVTTTTRPPLEASLPEYDIVSREQGEDGDTVVVLLDQRTFTTLTDIDVQDIITDVYERFPPVLVAHVVDTEQAAEYVLLDEVDEDQQAHLDLHYYARLEGGLRIIYQGRLAEAGIAILGS
jgi:hypothetical protein